MFILMYFVFHFQDCTIRSCDFDTEQTFVLHSPEKRMEQISPDTEVHLALTPLQPVVFFGFHRRMSVTGLMLLPIVIIHWIVLQLWLLNFEVSVVSSTCVLYVFVPSSASNSWIVSLHEVVGTVEGGRAPTKIKTDLKKPVVNLACHPRLPVLVTCLIWLRLSYLAPDMHGILSVQTFWFLRWWIRLATFCLSFFSM